MDAFQCPFSAGMITESTFFGFVRSVIRFIEITIPVTPFFRCNNREHLTALQRHLDNVFIGKADSTFSRPGGSYEDVHQKQYF
jgi:hypothetical protein